MKDDLPDADEIDAAFDNMASVPPSEPPTALHDADDDAADGPSDATSIMRAPVSGGPAIPVRPATGAGNPIAALAQLPPHLLAQLPPELQAQVAQLRGGAPHGAGISRSPSQPQFAPQQVVPNAHPSQPRYPVQQRPPNQYAGPPPAGYPQQAHPMPMGGPPMSQRMPPPQYPQQPQMPMQGGWGPPQFHAPQPPQQSAMPAGPTLIALTGVRKAYERSGESLTILDNLNLEIPKGAFVALMGPSGSGKSTLLNLLAGLDRPTSGTVVIDGKAIHSMNEAELARWRSENVGFIFQTYNLIPVLNAVENVELPLLLTKLGAAERRKRAQTALRIVGLEDRMKHYPRQLSGGQEQRVAIARAIVNDPILLVGDEPTGDLDRKSADEILVLLERLNRELGKTIVMVTHDPAAANRAQALRRLDKGALV